MGLDEEESTSGEDSYEEYEEDEESDEPEIIECDDDESNHSVGSPFIKDEARDVERLRGRYVYLNYFFFLFMYLFIQLLEYI